MRPPIPFIGLVTGAAIVAVVIVLSFRYYVDQLCAHGLQHFCS